MLSRRWQVRKTVIEAGVDRAKDNVEEWIIEIYVKEGSSLFQGEAEVYLDYLKAGIKLFDTVYWCSKLKLPASKVLEVKRKLIEKGLKEKEAEKLIEEVAKDYLNPAVLLYLFERGYSVEEAKKAVDILGKLNRKGIFRNYGGDIVEYLERMVSLFTERGFTRELALSEVKLAVEEIKLPFYEDIEEAVEKAKEKGFKSLLSVFRGGYKPLEVKKLSEHYETLGLTPVEAEWWAFIAGKRSDDFVRKVAEAGIKDIKAIEDICFWSKSHPLSVLIRLYKVDKKKLNDLVLILDELSVEEVEKWYELVDLFDEEVRKAIKRVDIEEFRKLLMESMGDAYELVRWLESVRYKTDVIRGYFELGIKDYRTYEELSKVFSQEELRELFEYITLEELLTFRDRHVGRATLLEFRNLKGKVSGKEFRQMLSKTLQDALELLYMFRQEGFDKKKVEDWLSVGVNSFMDYIALKEQGFTPDAIRNFFSDMTLEEIVRKAKEGMDCETLKKEVVKAEADKKLKRVFKL